MDINKEFYQKYDNLSIYTKNTPEYKNRLCVLEQVRALHFLYTGCESLNKDIIQDDANPLNGRRISNVGHQWMSMVIKLDEDRSFNSGLLFEGWQNIF